MARKAAPSDDAAPGGTEAPAVRAVADAIAAYLRTHPRGADTVEGIRHWWLRPAGVEASAETVLQALELLRDEGRVEIRRVGDRDLFRIPR